MNKLSVSYKNLTFSRILCHAPSIYKQRFFSSTSSESPDENILKKQTIAQFGKEDSSFTNQEHSTLNNNATGKAVYPPGAPREIPRSEMYGMKVYLEQGVRDRHENGITGHSQTSRWSHGLRDSPPQKFVNVDGQTYQIGVEPVPNDTRFWNAPRNTKYTWATVNIPQFFRSRKLNVANYDFIMKLDYCIFWIPSLIIFSLSVPTFCMTYLHDELAYTSMTVKVIGRQWYWVYEVESPVDDSGDGDDEDEDEEDEDEDEDSQEEDDEQ